MSDLLQEALCAVQERPDNYGVCEENFRNIAGIWGMVLGREVTPLQVALCLAGLKVARLAHNPGHRDSWVDLVGYAICAEHFLPQPSAPGGEPEQEQPCEPRKGEGWKLWETPPAPPPNPSFGELVGEAIAGRKG